MAPGRGRRPGDGGGAGTGFGGMLVCQALSDIFSVLQMVSTSSVLVAHVRILARYAKQVLNLRGSCWSGLLLVGHCCFSLLYYPTSRR
jgi:hypothetical protein